MTPSHEPQTIYDIRPTGAPASAPTSACLNCGTVLTGPFCARCGQRNVPPYPNVRELVVDAFWELSGWDGRFASTVRTLLRRPGMLTREFLEGRRARYLSPLRLYLLASLVYFVVAASAPNVRPGSVVEAGGIRIGVFTGGTAGTPTKPATTTKPASDGKADPDITTTAALTPELKEAALEGIADAPRWIKPVLRRAIEDPTRFKQALLEAMPRMLFALLPVFALILALFYRGRNYPEHLYFSIHLHAFIFLALAVSELAKFTTLYWLTVGVGVAALVWIPVYAHLSLVRVYGGSTRSTLAKGVGIGVLYGAASVPALVGLVMWAARS